MESTSPTEQDKRLPVRVWIGYACPDLRAEKNRTRLRRRLGSIFIPATVQIMQPLGLTAYLPTFLPIDHNPLIPDEVALVIYPSCRHYRRARSSSTGGRAYQLLHRTLFNFKPDNSLPASHSAFPILFDSSKVRDDDDPCTYFVLNNTVDWQSGSPVVLVADYDTGDSKTLRGEIIRKIAEIQAAPIPGINELIFFLGDSFVVLWVHWQQNPETMNLLEKINGLRVILNNRHTRRRLPMSFTADFAGIEVVPGNSFNFQFSTIGE